MTEAMDFTDDRADDEKYRAWLEDRKTGVGASEVSAALGLDPNKSQYSLWAEKCGYIEPDVGNEHQYWGRKLEPLVAAEFERRVNDPIVAIELPEFELQHHPTVPFLYASPDRKLLEMDPEPGEEPSAGALECKVADVWQLKAWRDAPPLQVQIQHQVQMACMSWDWGYIAALIGKQYQHTYSALVPDFVEEMILGVERFWHFVETRMEPAVDGSDSTLAALKKRWPKDDGNTIELESPIAAWIAEWEAAKEEKKRAEGIIQDAQTQLIHALGAATYGVIPGGGRLSYKQQTRKGYTTREKSFRVLRRVK